MSRAFVKEQDVVEDLPDRLISEHANLVTREGLAHIEAQVRRLSAEHAAAQAAEDREAVTATARDLRYWSAQAASAEVVTPPDGGRVHFGSTVSIERSSGRKQTFRIVGEDGAARMDGVVAQCVDDFDADGLMDALEREPGHACGGGPMVAVLRAARALGATRARVLTYADSGDVSGDKSSVVGYMAAAIW